MKIFSWAVSCWLLLLTAAIASAQENTLSPFFYIPDGDEMTASLPLLATTAEVKIAGIIADVSVRQVYKNDGEKPIEALYVFPGSTRSAIYGMQMQIGNRKILAKIQEKNTARQTYKRAKGEGRSASLLEQKRPNVFQMSVANILPGDTITVELSYTEILEQEGGTYSFVYPTVVGPRYGGEVLPALTAATSWVENPFLPKGKKAPYTFDLQLGLNTGVPIQQVQSPSHKIQLDFTGKAAADIKLDPSEGAGGDRDFILNYQLAGHQIQDGTLLWQGEKENFFLTLLQAPQRPSPATLVPREYIFLLDVSGSMRGYPLELATGVLKDLFTTLNPQDRFNILFFEGSAHFLSETSLAATPANLNKALSMLKQQRGGGGTNMLQAIEKAMSVKKLEGYSRSFAIVTDGYVSVEDRIFDYISTSLGDANFFALGIGMSVNRHLIEGIAHAGMSESFVATIEENSKSIADKFRQYIQSPVLTDIKVSFKGMDTYDVIPKRIPDLMAERPIMVFGKYKGAAKGHLQIEGNQAGKKYRRKVPIKVDKTATSNSALPYLWARHKIKILDDYSLLTRGENTAAQTETTQLGLEYGLLTRYTSFVAVDTIVRAHGVQATPVKQPLPLPKGVPNSAIGRQHASATAEDTEEEEPEFTDFSADVEEHYFTPPSAMVPPPPPPPAPARDEIFSVVEEMPYLKKCEMAPSYAERKSCSDKTILAVFSENLKIPKTLNSCCGSSLSVIQFAVGIDGKIKNIKVVRSLHPDLDKELIRVTKLLPDFIPGRSAGRRVEVLYNVPIRLLTDQ